MLMAISSEGAQAFVETDQARIADAIRDTVGFEKVDHLVAEALRKWCMDQTSKVGTRAAASVEDKVEDVATLQRQAFELNQTALLLCEQVRRLRRAA